MTKPKNAKEFRQNLAQQFIESLNKEGLEWKAGWQMLSSRPYNAVTARKYKGLNILNLAYAAAEKGSTDPRWVTFNQISDRDGKYHPGEKWHLKKGSEAAYVEYFYPYDTKEKKQLSWNEYKTEIDAGREASEFNFYSKYFAVFNAIDVEGMPPLEKTENLDIKPSELVEKLSGKMNVPIYYDGIDRAFYRPAEDAIHLPAASSFNSAEELAATSLHELAHATGHESRLNRNIQNSFGTENYAYEELVAEMTSSFMTIRVDEKIPDILMENHKAYINSWIKEVENNPDVLVSAIRDAERASTYMDYMAEIITEAEYKSIIGSSIEVNKDSVKVQESDVVLSRAFISEGYTENDKVRGLFIKDANSKPEEIVFKSRKELLAAFPDSVAIGVNTTILYNKNSTKDFSRAMRYKNELMEAIPGSFAIVAHDAPEEYFSLQDGQLQEYKELFDEFNVEFDLSTREIGQMKDALSKKIFYEWLDFSDELLTKTPQEIFNASYEKVMKEEFYMILSENIDEDEYSIEELKALNDTDNILEKAYLNWLKEDVSDEIRTSLAMSVREIKNKSLSLQNSKEKLSEESFEL